LTGLILECHNNRIALIKGLNLNSKFDRKNNTRNMILETAETLFKKYGIESSGIKKIMNEIGLTVGGFYSHFKSKDDLIKNSLNRSLNSIMRELLDHASHYEGKEKIIKILDIYLGVEHKNNIERGCPVAAMASDISRCNEEIKKEVVLYLDNFFEEIKTDVEKLSLGERKITREDFYVYMSMSLGAVMMARICQDEVLSNNILASTKKKILQDLKMV
jgi:TetR/AcrR family transcriptional repressor of nem operon